MRAKASRCRRFVEYGSFLVLILITATGCGAPVEEASFELGTGSWRFEPIEDGESVELIRGAQGGWHIWISLRAEGLDVANGRVRMETQLADESRPPQIIEPRVAFDPPNSSGVRQLIGLGETLVDPGCLVGNMVRLRATWLGADGLELSSERYVMVAGGAYPPDGC